MLLIPFSIVATLILALYVGLYLESEHIEKTFPWMWWFVWGALLAGYISVTAVLKRSKHRELKEQFHLFV